MISAGFDAGHKDVGNRRIGPSEYVGGLDLEGRDFAWVTRQIVHVVSIFFEIFRALQSF